MSKRKSKKKKQKKDSRKSSSSSDDNEKSSKVEECTKKRKSSERRHHSSCHDSSAEKQRKGKQAHCSTSRNVASESSSQKDREYKKAVYKRGKTESLDRRHHAKEEVGVESKNASSLGTLTQDHSRKSCPSQDRKSGAGRRAVVTPEGKTSERGSSKPASTNREIRVSQSEHKTPIFHVSPSRSSQWSPAKAVSPRQTMMSPRSVSLKLKEQRKMLVKRSKPEGTFNTEKDSQNAQLSPSLFEELREKRRKLDRRRSQEEREEALKTKRDLYGGKGFSHPSNTTITTKQSSTSTKNITTSERSSNPSKLIITRNQGNVTEPSQTAKSVCAQGVIPPAKPQMILNFKIQKKTKPLPVGAIWDDDKDSTNNKKPIGSRAKSKSQPTVSRKTDTIPSVKGFVVNRTDQRSALVPDRSHSSHPHPLTPPPQHQAPRDGAVLRDSSVQGMTSSRNRTPWIKQTQTTVSSTEDTEIYDNDQEMQLVEELHLARSQRRLEVNVVESYGELTCMDIDQPEEGANVAFSKEQPQQDLIIVLDTNILLSHLDFVKKMRSHGLGRV